MTDAATKPTVHQDNLLGICHAIGRDLGFNPLWLRLAISSLLLFSLELPFVIYGVLGVIVLASRLVARPRKARPSAEILPLARRDEDGTNDDAEFARAA